MTKKALISTIEGTATAQRVVEVVDVGNEFDVHSNLVWKDCADDITAEHHLYNSETNTFYKDTTILDQQVADAGVIDENTQRYVWDYDTNSWTVENLPVPE